jgi:hypothetical protein
MTRAQFANFQDSLAQALLRDGFSPGDCDVRLKGSSASFYSGWHKLMPYDREMLDKVFRSSYVRPPSQSELDVIEANAKTGWPSLLRPIRRPFDSINRIGIVPTPTDNNLSDYDVQVSSDEIADCVRAHHAQVGGDLVSDHGGHFHKLLVESVCKNLGKLWPTSQANTLGRKVGVAVFPALGPENQTAKIGHLSSHFRSTDWILI